MLKSHYYSIILEAGTDEAGRGCLAGPVTAAAVINPNISLEIEADLNTTYWSKMNDSKQMSEKDRFFLRPIIEKLAVAHAVTHIDPNIIDEINILNASLLAMRTCIDKLEPQPIYIIVDGNRPLIKSPMDENGMRHYNNIPFSSIIKGDANYLSIAAASILAKTYRDDYMNVIHEEYPMYHWDKNKGYPTKDHREAIAKYGLSPYHRKSFKLKSDNAIQLGLDFQ